jgi:chaperone BCS1
MGPDGSDGPGYGANLLGAMSITTLINQILEQAGPVLKTFGIDLDVLITLFVVGTMVAAGWHYVGDFIDEVVSRYYKCTVRITSEDAMFAALMEFLEEHRVFGTAEEQVSASSDICGIAGNRRLPWYAKPTRNLDANMDKWDADYWDSDSDTDEELDDSSFADTETPYLRMKKKIKYAPMTGYPHYFYFKPTGHTVQVRRSEPENGNGPWWRRQREYVSLSIYDRDPAPLKALLQRVCDRENKKNIGRTTVFKAVRGADADNAIWERCFSRAARPIHTVILDEEQKEAICQDMAEYLMPATSKWYANRGLPYRRGYLLYGPPGEYPIISCDWRYLTESYRYWKDLLDRFACWKVWFAGLFAFLVCNMDERRYPCAPLLPTAQDLHCPA